MMTRKIEAAVSFVLVVSCVLFLVFITSCSKTPTAQVIQIDDGLLGNKDLFKIDVFKNYNRFLNQTDFDSRDVSILGVRLGDPESVVLARLGEPDYKRDFGELGINYYYGTRFGVNTTDSLIIHFDNGVVTRWTIYHDLNDLLKGKTKINKTEKQIYREFGLPDKIYRQFTSIKLMYNEGFDIILNDANREVGISFIDPDVQEQLTVQEYETIEVKRPYVINVTKEEKEIIE